MTVRTFGRKGQVGEEGEIARRREAFLAEERARKARLQQEGATGGSDAVSAGPVVVREKSLAIAYVLWFFGGAISAHRFYLGYPVSAAIQAGLWMTCWLMILGGFMLAVLALLWLGLWILSDAFFIPGLHRRANERARRPAVHYVFT